MYLRRYITYTVSVCYETYQIKQTNSSSTMVPQNTFFCVLGYSHRQMPMFDTFRYYTFTDQGFFLNSSFVILGCVPYNCLCEYLRTL